MRCWLGWVCRAGCRFGPTSLLGPFTRFALPAAAPYLPPSNLRTLVGFLTALNPLSRLPPGREPTSGRKTGVAYLQYSSAAEAQAALGLDGERKL